MYQAHFWASASLSLSDCGLINYTAKIFIVDINLMTAKIWLHVALTFISCLFIQPSWSQLDTYLTKKDAYYFAVKGGISLGSYETGLNRHLLRYVEQQKSDLIAFSGASAGSINSILSAIDACIIDKRITKDETALNDSLNKNFMKWVWDIGIDDLVPAKTKGGKPNDSTQGSIFSRQGFDGKKALIAQLIDRQAVSDCDIIITMSITKVDPYQFDISEIGETVKLQRFVVPLRVFEKNNQLVIENYKDIHQRSKTGSIQFPSAYLMLVENSQGQVEFEDVWNLALASSAFPMAFSPVSIRYCYPHELKGERCLQGRARKELFSDGGLFDNSPIGVSLDVYDLFKDESLDQPHPIKLIYINPDSYRTGEGIQEKKLESQSVTGIYDYGTYFFNSFSNALDNEYRTALERLSKIDTSVRNFYMTNRYHHLLADLHAHFGAFYTPEYRMHDYLVGVYDAQNLVAKIECDSGNSMLSGKRINRFEVDYQDCVREGVLSWVESLDFSVCEGGDHSLLSDEENSVEFFRYLYNTEYEKSLALCNQNKNVHIVLARSFGNVGVTRSSQLDYSEYLDRLDIYAKDLTLSKNSGLKLILTNGRKYTAQKLSNVYENIVEMQTKAGACETCPDHVANQYIGTGLKVIEPIVDSFISHHDSGIWPLPIQEEFSVNYGFNLSQKNQILSLDYRPKAFTFGRQSIDMSLAFHDYGGELGNDDYASVAIGLTQHSNRQGFVLTTWSLGYQHETKGSRLFPNALDSLYLKVGLLNELISFKYLYRLDDIPPQSIQTRADQAFVLSIDVSKVCKMVLPDWCGR